MERNCQTKTYGLVVLLTPIMFLDIFYAQNMKKKERGD